MKWHHLTGFRKLRSLWLRAKFHYFTHHYAHFLPSFLYIRIVNSLFLSLFYPQKCIIDCFPYFFVVYCNEWFFLLALVTFKECIQIIFVIPIVSLSINIYHLIIKLLQEYRCSSFVRWEEILCNSLGFTKLITLSFSL